MGHIKTCFGRKSIIFNIVLMLIIAVLLLFALLFGLNIYTRHGQNIEVPDLRDHQINEAEAILKAKDLQLEIVDSLYRKEGVPGAIISHIPKPGNKVKRGRAIYLTVYAQRPQQVSIPNLTDYSTRQAIALLNSIGFTDITVEEVPSAYSGLVISVQYKSKILFADEKIPVGSPLKLVVGAGGNSEDSAFVGVTREKTVDRSDVKSTGKSSQNSVDESFFN